MWYIKDVKRRGWECLKRNYWKAFAITLLASVIVVVITNSITSIVEVGGVGVLALLSPDAYPTELIELSENLSISFIMPPITWILEVLLGLPLLVGMCRCFMQLRERNTSIMGLFHVFHSQYGNIVKTSFLQNLFTVLWSLLLFIPGIVKYYEYSMIPYILAENPEINWKRAFQLSKEMTQGEKMQIFLTDLSFTGWYLAGILACGIGVVFVVPYHQAAKAEVYAVMRDKAFYQGFSNSGELRGFSE